MSRTPYVAHLVSSDCVRRRSLANYFEQVQWNDETSVATIKDTEAFVQKMNHGGAWDLVPKDTRYSTRKIREPHNEPIKYISEKFIIVPIRILADTASANGTRLEVDKYYIFTEGVIVTPGVEFLIFSVKN